MREITICERLMRSIKAACPLAPGDPVSLGRLGVPASCRFEPAATATPAQLAAGQAAIDSFDWSDAAHRAYEDSLEPARTDLRQQAAQAVQSLDAYIAIADGATAAQVRDQVKRLSQMMRRVIVRLVQVE